MCILSIWNPKEKKEKSSLYCIPLIRLCPCEFCLFVIFFLFFCSLCSFFYLFDYGIWCWFSLSIILRRIVMESRPLNCCRKQSFDGCLYQCYHKWWTLNDLCSELHNLNYGSLAIWNIKIIVPKITPLWAKNERNSLTQISASLFITNVMQILV